MAFYYTRAVVVAGVNSIPSVLDTILYIYTVRIPTLLNRRRQTDQKEDGCTKKQLMSSVTTFTLGPRCSYTLQAYKQLLHDYNLLHYNAGRRVLFFRPLQSVEITSITVVKFDYHTIIIYNNCMVNVMINYLIYTIHIIINTIFSKSCLAIPYCNKIILSTSINYYNKYHYKLAI